MTKDPIRLRAYAYSFFNKHFPEIISVVFFILGAIGIAHHDMWRDEMQAWMIAQGSRSIPELLYNLRYESHPPLWYFLLYFIKQFTSNPPAIQVVHITIATINSWLLLRFSPFSRFQRVLLVFGYFLFYEYALISRCYALGILFAFLFCVLICRPYRNYLLLSFVLTLLCLTSMMGLILAVAFAAFVVYEFSEKPPQRDRLSQIYLAGLLFVTAVLVSLNSMVPPEDGGYIKSLFREHGPQVFFSNIYAAYFPYFLTLFHHQIPYKVVEIFSVLFFIFTLFLFIRKKSVLFLYIIGVLAFVVFFSTVYSKQPRHLGHLFILLIACWWIYPKVPGPGNLIMTIVLLIQFVLGCGAYRINYIYTFADGRLAAEYIRVHKLDVLPMIGDSFGVLTVSGYLGKPIYYARENRWGTFVLYDNKRSPSQRALLEKARDLSKMTQRDSVLILTYPIRKSYLLPQIQTLAVFNKCLHEPDGIYLYKYDNK